MANPIRVDRVSLVERALDMWGDNVYRLALSQLRSSADAQDVVQEVFLKLLAEKRVFQGEDHLKAWLLRCALNRCHDLQRSAWSRRVESLEGAAAASDVGSNRIRAEDIHDPSIDVERQAEQALYQHPVWRFMDELPDDQRAVMHLRYVEEYTTEEIAQILQVRSATVRTRLHRARKRLQKLLEQEVSERERVESGPHATPHQLSHAKTAVTASMKQTRDETGSLEIQTALVKGGMTR